MQKHRLLYFLIFSVTLICYIDRIAVAYAVESIESELGLSHFLFGVMSAGFGLGYGLSALVSGWLVDRVGPKKTWTTAVLVWSMAMLLTGFSQTFLQLFCLRILLGLGEGAHFPALTRTLADEIPHAQKGRTFSIALFAVPASSLIGAPLLSFCIASLGWRWVFTLLGLLGGIWVIFWQRHFQETPHPSVRTGGRPPWRKLLFSPTFLAHHFAFFTFGYLIFFATLWLPAYLSETFHLSLPNAGIVLTIPWAGACFSVLLGGVISDRLFERTGSLRKARSHLIFLSFVLATLFFAPIGLFSSFSATLLFLTLGLSSAFFCNSSFFATQSDLTHPHAGAAQGINTSVFALSGILSPIITGWITTKDHEFTKVFLPLIFLTSVSLVLLYFLHFQESNPSDRKHSHRDQ